MLLTMSSGPSDNDSGAHRTDNAPGRADTATDNESGAHRHATDNAPGARRHCTDNESGAKRHATDNAPGSPTLPLTTIPGHTDNGTDNDSDDDPEARFRGPTTTIPSFADADDESGAQGSQH